MWSDYLPPLLFLIVIFIGFGLVHKNGKGGKGCSSCSDCADEPKCSNENKTSH